ncbi:aldehyde dehydrogenase family protein [Nocardia sp. R7R-8]|uniref:aldehyde dehydrogenase family protein n=1 Tax=Nocardia sp. R7R-8 TaxID=3459304 RepID=UPI00403E35CC
MPNFSMTIGGEQVAGSSRFAVINPATSEPFAEAPDCSAAQLDLAVTSAEKAYTSWRTDEGARREAMLRAADRLEAEAENLGRVLTQEQGRPLPQSPVEMTVSAYWLRYYATLDTPAEVLQDDERAYVKLLRQPLGPVAAITPWNFPVVLAFWKIAPALRAGNTLVLKPSPFTPLTTLKIGELLADVLPPGVLNVVSGLEPLGAGLTAHRAIRKISFTGSTVTGRKVALAAAEDFKRVTLELGGNDPAIVLDDADPQTVAAGIFASAMGNTGQSCVAVKRTYVPRKLYGDVVAALVDEARAAKVGNGLEAGVEYGPLNNRPQWERVAGLVADAMSAGATVEAGGPVLDGPGYFYAPTILTDVNDDMAVVAEEQFGPVLPVLPYDSVPEVIARANATHFGLGSSIWTGDPQRGLELAPQIEAGTTWINNHIVLPPTLPFGGVKWSGIGVENGVWGLHEFTDVHVVHQPRALGAGWP